MKLSVGRHAAWFGLLSLIVLLLVNVLIAWKLFSLEYSGYLESNEGTFIAIARGVAEHPGDLLWWPLWNVGMPFQNTYLPLLPVLVGMFSRIAGISPALSFHSVSAALYCIGPVLLYVMASRISRRPIESFFAALAYSLISPSTILVPVIRNDVHGMWNLRRLHVLAYYGEGPHNATMAFLPLAILFLYLALTRRRWGYGVAAGVAIAAVVLSNAFGAVILAMAALCLLATVETGRFGRNLATMALIGTLTYCWISPFIPPSVLAAIRMNSPTVDGDYRFTSRSMLGVFVLVCGFGILWLITRRRAPPLRFCWLFAWLTSGVTLLDIFFNIYVVPQPHRYHIVMDMALCLLAAFTAGSILARMPRRGRILAIALVLVAAAIQMRHDVRYARGLIRWTDITQTTPYRIATWVDRHMVGQRVMISGSYSFHFNVFTDTPQLFGGHDPMLPNFVDRIAAFFIYTGMNAGDRDGEVAILWLKALGAHAISVPGTNSLEYYKPFTNPKKFDGLLSELWREGDDVIYAIPSRSSSLAHAIPASAVVEQRPAHGLDVCPIARYVKALDDPANPETPMRWESRHTARIQAQLPPGQIVSVQVNYHPGWHASIDGRPQKVRSDGLGLLVVEPACQNPCEISLTYDGRPELLITGLLSGSVALLVLFWCAAAAVRRTRLHKIKLTGLN